MIEDRLGLIRVTNGNLFEFSGRYGGRDYKFKPEVPIDVPEAVAAHIFCFGRDDKTTALNRLGWARTSEEMEAGLAKLANVTFEDPPELVEVPRPKKPKKGKPADDDTGTAGPPVNAGGPEGGGFNPPPNGPKIGSPEKASGDEF